MKLFTLSNIEADSNKLLVRVETEEEANEIAKENGFAIVNELFHCDELELFRQMTRDYGNQIKIHVDLELLANWLMADEVPFNWIMGEGLNMTFTKDTFGFEQRIWVFNDSSIAARAHKEKEILW